MATIRMNIARSISEIIESEKMSKKDFAEKFGVTKGSVTNWTSGRNAPDIEILVKISREYNMPLSTLLGTGLTIDSSCYDSAPIFKDVPIYGKVEAGLPIEKIRSERALSIPAVIGAEYPNAFFLRVVGESMNRRLPNGSLALVNPEDTEVEDDAPYALCINRNDAIIKKVSKLDNGLLLIPDSCDPTFLPETFNYNESETEKVTILGKVVWVAFPFDYKI